MDPKLLDFGPLGFALLIMYVLIKEVIGPLVQKKKGNEGVDSNELQTLANQLATVARLFESLIRDNHEAHKEIISGVHQSQLSQREILQDTKTLIDGMDDVCSQRHPH